MGSAIHRAIELFHRQQLEDDRPATLDEMLDAFWDEWKSRIDEAPEVRFGKSEDVNSIGKLADRMLQSFLDSGLHKLPGVIIGIEEGLTGALLAGSPDFVGVVDLIAEDGDTLIIRDLFGTTRRRDRAGTRARPNRQLTSCSFMPSSHGS